MRSKIDWEFLGAVPDQPGVYRIFNAQSVVVYVGKAKNLRRRLSQYKNVKRVRRHRRMYNIVREGVRIEYSVCGSELEAELTEVKSIQNLRPKWNIVGAFSFLYPMVGLYSDSKHSLFFCYTTRPELCSEFIFHGAFRSRETTSTGFFALMKLLEYVGHVEYVQKPRIKFTYIFGFRNLPKSWLKLWHQFFQGSSHKILEELVLALVENAGARRQGVEIQECLNQLKRFWKHEIVPLTSARIKLGWETYPIRQSERDQVFIQYRHYLAANLKAQKAIAADLC